MNEEGDKGFNNENWKCVILLSEWMKYIVYIYDIILLHRHAVRRFVQENQGLMRRMYGDERHINVLRAEFERNDVELKYDDYYHHFSDDHR